jgi:CHASE1-domain containing sensor protein
MNYLISAVTLGIAIIVLWTQLILTLAVWNLAENVSEINHRIQINKLIKEQKHEKKK